MSAASDGVRQARAVVVLAGGRSERFGSDKTRAELDGVALLERTLGAVGAMTALIGEILVVGPWAPDGVRHVVEPDRFGGPLAALSFVLGEVSSPLVLVLAADHPNLRPELLGLLLDRLDAEPGVDAIVPVRDGRREPLVAAYRRSVGSVARELLAGDERSLQALLRAISVIEVVEAEWRAVDPEGTSFRDIDRPEDLDPGRSGWNGPGATR